MSMTAAALHPSAGLARTTAPAERDLVDRVSLGCIIIYITIYAFESPVRYLLNLIRLDNLILLRDGLIILPLGLVFIRDLARGRLHPAMTCLMVFGGLAFVVGYLNFHSLAAAALGGKQLFNVVLGLMFGMSLINPGKRLSRLLLVFWAATVVGVVLEKFFVTFPWVGLHATIGNLDVEISRDWQVADAFQKRVGGFTRVSISAASLMPLLVILTATQVKSFLVRNAMFMITIGAVFLTTQKGAMVALLAAWGAFLAPAGIRTVTQMSVAFLSILVDVTAPFLTNGILLPIGGGSSLGSSSLIWRIVLTWPQSLAFIGRHQLGPFGDGLGGIGESLRFVASEGLHYPDSLVLFLYSAFGMVSLLFWGVIAYAVTRATKVSATYAGRAVGVLTFIVLYGTVVSIIEDQIMALLLGCSIGALLSGAPAVAGLDRPAPTMLLTPGRGKIDAA